MYHVQKGGSSTDFLLKIFSAGDFDVFGYAEHDNHHKQIL